jgi:cation diffusion facilitator CzcD-associated flavoprotein CzcO
MHNSVYASLRLTSPRDIMGFSDFPFFPRKNDGDSRRYPGHAEFLRYIRDYCDTFVNTKVLHVGRPLLAPLGGDGVTRWTVRYSSRHGVSEDEAAVVAEEEFDAADLVVYDIIIVMLL